MRTEQDLTRILRRIDRRGYKAYKDIEGVYSFGRYRLFIDHAQGDPFATPSRIRVRVPAEVAGFPPDTYRSKSRKVGLSDFLTRIFRGNIKRYSKGIRGSGNSGLIEIDAPGQEVLERTSIIVDPAFIEARFAMGLPARGRTIAARDAEDMFFRELPRIIEESLIFSRLDRDRLYRHIETVEDADFIRGKLDELGLVAFLANDSLLPRASGVDESPMRGENVVLFRSPASLEVTIETPNKGKVSGMGIPKGVTLIVGGGYHGKSTLLRAIELGVYNHIPGDGRELVIANPKAVKIRAEDGRRVEKVDISPFINNLPFGKDTTAFSTDDASGSTSQAANIIEALEVGAELLLIDEDTSATNFMIRDHRMQELVAKDKEPITPFIDKVKLLYRDCGVSTVLVLGGSGDYFDVADYVIKMEDYLPHDVTVEAHRIAEKYKAERKMEGGDHFGKPRLGRIPLPGSLDARRGKREVKLSVKGKHTIIFGRQTIDLSAVEQIVDVSQTRAIADAIIYARNRYMDGRRTLREVVDLLERDIEAKGLDVINPLPLGIYARPRRFEIAAAINRLRGLTIIANR
ncbi:MAG: ABC-ATPase domain-containing protein [Acidobacteria bacterium]|nr:ABC-ATPase domain-containing protein [Acidobacteriota bacterium]